MKPAENAALSQRPHFTEGHRQAEAAETLHHLLHAALSFRRKTIKFFPENPASAVYAVTKKMNLPVSVADAQLDSGYESYSAFPARRGGFVQTGYGIVICEGDGRNAGAAGKSDNLFGRAVPVRVDAVNMKVAAAP
jgi:hypothetical protein